MKENLYLTNARYIFMVFLLALCTYNADSAQKVLNFRDTNMRAQNLISIDGKANDWNTKLLVRNKAADVRYFITNDDRNLYLIVQATDHTVVNKILGGGLTLTINTTGKKDQKGAFSITYPVLDIKNRVWVDLRDRPEIISGSAKSIAEADSFMTTNNARLIEKSKFIMVTGLKNIDTLISIFNQDGIKAAALFDNQMVYTYELSFDLNKLGQVGNRPAKIAYNIMLNGVNMDAVNKAAGIIITRDAKGTPTMRFSKTVDFRQYLPLFPLKVDIAVFSNPTDFWGEYILINK